VHTREYHLTEYLTVKGASRGTKGLVLAEALLALGGQGVVLVVHSLDGLPAEARVEGPALACGELVVHTVAVVRGIGTTRGDGR